MISATFGSAFKGLHPASDEILKSNQLNALLDKNIKMIFNQ